MPTKNFSTSGWAPYADRATAAAATVPAWIDTISYIGPSRGVLQFVEDDAATAPALTTADGRKWVPAGEATPYHYGAAGGGADDTAAVVSAWASGLPVLLNDTHTVTGALTLAASAHVRGKGKIVGATSGTRPDKASLLAAANNAARTALLEAYYPARVTLTGSTWNINGPTFENILFKSTSEPVIYGAVTLTNCAADNVEFKAGAGAFVNAPGIIVTNCGGAAISAQRGGAFLATGAIITNGQRGLYALYGGIIDAENCHISTMSNYASFILYSGSVNVKGAVVDNCASGGLINNYGGDYNAENITITDIPAGVAAAIESNGSAFMQGATIARCLNAFAVALGGFIQARNSSISDITVVIANALNDGMISLENITVSGTNPNAILFQARGAGRLQMSAPGAGGLASVPASALTPAWGAVGNGAAYIGLMTSTGAAASGVLPGPYADDAAAAAAGVPVGGNYRKTGGTMAWRQA